MTPIKGKNKRGKLPDKYPGKLGRRRKSTGEQRYIDGTTAEPIVASVLDWVSNIGYYDEGIALIADYLKIKAPPFQQVRGTGLASSAVPSHWGDNAPFLFELSLRLLQRHVPYFQWPTRRGRPATLQSRFPALELLINAINGKVDWPIKIDWTVEDAYAAIAKRAGCSQETVEREFREWKRKRRLRGGNVAQ